MITINGLTKRQKAGLYLFKYIVRHLLGVMSSVFRIGFQIQVITDENEMINRVNQAHGEALLATLQQLKQQMTQQDPTRPQA